MLDATFIKWCLFSAAAILSIQPHTCDAAYPTGTVLREREVDDRFFAGLVPPDNVSELQIVRFSDSHESLPTEWNAVETSERIVITERGAIARITSLLKRTNTSAALENSRCPVLGAFVGHLQNPRSDWVVLFFYAYDDHLTLRSPSGMSTDDTELWRYIMDRYSKLLRPTKGAELTARAKAQDTDVKRIFYRDGSLRTTIPIAHGQFNGIGKNYFKNGRVSQTLPYRDGKLDGIAKSYAENGKLLGETCYATGERHGADSVYDENGRLLGTSWWWHGKSIPKDEFSRLAGTGKRN